MSCTSFHLERQVHCPEQRQDGLVYLEQSETLDGEVVELFSCTLMEDQPGCRRRCLHPWR